MALRQFIKKLNFNNKSICIIPNMTRLITNTEIENILDFITPIEYIPQDTAISITKKIKAGFRKQLQGQMIYPEILPELKKQIIKQYQKSQIQPGESIGVICAQSIGEKNTQTSVAYDEKVFLMKNGKIINTTVGKFIDTEMSFGSVINTEYNGFYKQPSETTYILTIGQDESTSWKPITELSKHPPMGNLVKVTTQSGRSVITTLSHSHLKKEGNSIVPILGSDLKLGDRIPVVKKCVQPTLNTSDILISNYIIPDKLQNNLIYVKNTSLSNIIQISEIFMWFLGAYLSEGFANTYQTSITNISQIFQKGVYDFAKQLNLKCITKTEIRPLRGGIRVNSQEPDKRYTSTSYIINNRILASFMQEICGTGSYNKKIPDFVYSLPNKYIAPIIRAWIDSNGNIQAERKCIRGFSMCRNLLEQFSVLFSYFGIFGTIKLQSKNSKNSKLYQYYVYGKKYCKLYLEHIGSDLDYKKKALQDILVYPEEHSNHIEMIPYYIGTHITIISKHLCMKGHSRSFARYERLSADISRNCLGHMINQFEQNPKHKDKVISDNMKYVYQAYNSDIVWDKITNIDVIQEKEYNYEYVYDFSVKDNETFALQSGILVHNTLNTFHHAGQSEKTMTAGVPRLQELLNATKNPRIVNHTIYLTAGNNSIQELRSTVGHSIAGLTLKDISNDIFVCPNKKPEPWYDAFKILYTDNFSNHNHCITFILNMKTLFEFKLTLQQIAKYIENEYTDLYCVFSPPAEGKIDVFVDITNITLPENRIAFINQENAPMIYLEEVVQVTLEKMYICGIPAITEIFYTKQKGEWLLETNGFNSKNISKQYSSFKKLLAHPYVDYTRTISNNVWDIYEVLDIEAARQFLIEEFLNIMDGINQCHTMLLVDRMTYGGTIASISRYTLKADECGPLGKCSFEETLDNFLLAAAQGQHEPTKGVSASIICGKRSSIGTGMINVGIDIPKLPAPIWNLPKKSEKVKDKVFKNSIIEEKDIYDEY